MQIGNYSITFGILHLEFQTFQEWALVSLCFLALLFAAYLLEKLKTGRKLVVAVKIIFYLLAIFFLLFFFFPLSIYFIVQLIRLFLNLNYGNTFRNSILSKCAAKGDVKTLQKLLSENKLNINEPNDSYGWTPLFYAVDNKQTETVSFLLASGADVNIKDNNDKTPLHYAKTEEIKKILLAYGAIDEKETQQL